MKFFRGSPSGPEHHTNSGSGKHRLTRRSSGLGELARHFRQEEPMCILDIGATSASNIRYFTERGQKIYSEDLLVVSTDPALITKDENGKAAIDCKRFLTDNLTYPNGQFDIILCWNLADYLDESLVKPVIARLWSTLRPGGLLLAFFHTQEAGPDSPCYRYHIVDQDTLEMSDIEMRRDARKGPSAVGQAPNHGGFRLQRVFNNRHIENLFRDFASIKFFLTRDNIREVLVVR